MLIQLGTLAPSLKSYLILHHTTLAVDLLITIFGNVNRMDFVFIITSWIIQVLLVIFLGVLFLFRFTSSFPFKAGMLQIMFREFSVEIGTFMAYLVVLVCFRASLVYPAAICTWLNQCDWMYFLNPVDFSGLFSFRLVSIWYYYICLRGAVRLCNPKYYMYSAWMAAKMQQELE